VAPQGLLEIIHRKIAVVSVAKAVKLHTDRVCAGKFVANAEARLFAHRRTGDGIEHDGTVRRFQVTLAVVEVLRENSAAIAKRGQTLAHEFESPGHPPALFDVSVVILGGMYFRRESAALDKI